MDPGFFLLGEMRGGRGMMLKYAIVIRRVAMLLECNSRGNLSAMLLGEGANRRVRLAMVG